MPRADAITKVFDGKSLLAGIFCLLVGGGLLAWALFFSDPETRNRVWFGILGMGGVFVFAGVLLVPYALRADGCKKCRAAFERSYTFFPIELIDRVRQSVADANADVESIVALGATPIPRFGFDEAASIEVAYCPKCMQVAQLQSAVHRRLADDDTTTEDVSPEVVITGDGVRRVLDLIKSRNQAWTAALMNGGAS